MLLCSHKQWQIAIPNNNLYMNNRTSLLILILTLTLMVCASTSFSQISLTAMHSNQGYATDYLYQFAATYSYQWATIRVDFPIEYILSIFQSTLDCWVSNSGIQYDYQQANCHVQPSTSLASYFVVGSVYVDAQNIVGGTPFFVLLRNIINPVNRDMTSFFSVCILVERTEIECERTFARLLLSSPNVISSGQIASFESSPQFHIVGQGNSYIFTFPVSTFASWYSNSEYISVRAIFPKEFESNSPLCSIASRLTSYEMTYKPVDTKTYQTRPYIIVCERITNFTSFLQNGNQLSIKIDTIINPLKADIWTGVKFQVVRSIHNQLIETIPLGQPIKVLMESFMVSPKQTNHFRNATTIYYLYVNHDVILNNSSSLQISIGNGSKWNIHSVSLLNGFTSPKTAVSSIKVGSTVSKIVLTNYGTASRKQQQCIALNLTSPITVGYHNVTLLAKVNSNDVGFWSGAFYINTTYGEFDLLSLSAVRKKQKLAANATGSLQLTFFLNYQLPESQGLKNGSLRVSIYPQLAPPNPDINGVLKCYFKGTFQASNCTMDNSDPTKTIFTILSPPLEAYQYSEVPILITTQGSIDENYTGFPIDPLVTRYRFETEFYLYNSSTIPSEVFYTEWIADAIEMDAATAFSLTFECNEWTSVQVNLTMPVLSPISLARQLRIRVDFMAHPITKINGWDLSLGYSSNRIYKQYPCIITGLVGARIRCDLYTYTSSTGTSPYNNLHIKSDSTGSYFIIYGFLNTNLNGLKVMMEFPKLKVGALVNVPAMVQVSILEQTPAQLEPYVALYFQNITVFTTLPAISIGQTSVSTSQSIVVPVQTTQQYNMSWSPLNPSQVIYIKYQISSAYFPSFPTSSGTCTTSLCFSAGYPANWIVQKPNLPVTSPYTLKSLLAFITTIPFLNTESQLLPIHITTYDGTGNTIDKVFMSYNYTVQQMVGYFDFLEPVYYAGLAQWYSISFSNAPVTVSQYPSIRLILDSNLIFSTPLQCNSTTVLPYNSSGLLFKQESSVSLLVYNLMQIAASGTYQLNCRLQTTQHQFSSMISPTIDIQLHHNYSLGDTFTATVNDVLLQQAPVLPNKAKPHQFQIDNPQILNEEPRVNYVGPLFVDFTSTSNFSNYLKITLDNHRYNKAGWTTPNFNSGDPPVCLLNNKRYSCSWTDNPLTITINSPVFTIGSNKLELTSEYVAPYNGVKFPGTAGQYLIQMALLDVNSTLLQTHTFFVNIIPPPLLHFEASSIVKDIGTESVYIVNFTIPTWATFPNPYNHPTNYSRIFIEFPTQVDGVPLFSSNLGGYKGITNERVGCSFVLGTPYIAAIPTQQLQCVLIPPEFSGARVKVEIINHNGFSATLNSMALYIFKIFNPAVAYRSFDLRVSINQYEVGSGFMYPLYWGKYTIFLDPYANNTTPLKTLTVDDQTLVNFFDPALSVGNYGPVTLTAQSLTGNYLNDPFYVIFKLPPYLPPENNQVTNPFKLCPAAQFQLCITSPEINYVLVKAKGSPSSFQVFIRNYPSSISQIDSLFQASVVEEGRYTGQIIYSITSYRWNQIQGAIVFNSLTASGSTLKLDMNKKQAQILVSFTTQSAIPASGTIEIVFPTTITHIYPNCRSATGKGSSLYSAAGVGALGPSGQIGCTIQNTNHWAITSFLPVSNATLIIIRGYIDLPAASGSIGMGQIITYADNHQTDIYTNGSRIDYVKADFLLTISSTQAMNANSDIFLSQRSVLATNYVGQFRYLFTLNYTLYLQDYIQLSLYKKDIKANAGGFALNNRPIVCEFIRIDTEQRVGCFVDLATQTNIYMHEVLMYHLRPVENLLPSVTYQARLTSQDYTTPQGIHYPTSPGTYKVDFLTNHTTVGLVELEQRYIEVVATPFSKLIITQFNYLAGYYSPFWVELSPTAPISANHQIILQFPTLSNDGATRLFSDDLGWSVGNGQGIPIDMFDCLFSNTFMNCRIVYGSYQYGKPAKIICGNLQTAITIGQTLKFAFSMTNPSPLTSSVLSQIAIPIFVYTYDPQLYQKINYNTVNVGAIVNSANNTGVPTAFFSTNNNQLETPNEQLRLSRYNTKAFAVGDFYVVKFNFPIRVNAKVVSGCRDNLGNIIGTAYYHENLRTIVCALTVGLATNAMPSFANLMIMNFYTPWYMLTAPERQVTAIASYQLTAQSEYISYYDPFPLFSPRSLGFSPAPYFAFTPLIPHNIACQQNDYIFTMRLESSPSANFDLQYTKMVLVTMPNQFTADFQAVNTDCMEHSSSTIEITSCRVDPVSRFIEIVVVPGVYQNGHTLAVVTRGLAIKNPCSYFNYWGSSTLNAMYWSVYYLSFENGTAMTPSPNYAYLVINSLNMQSATQFYNYETTIASWSLYSPFDWMEIPYQRYYHEFLQYDANQYSPFSFEFQLTTALPAVTYNKLTVQFGSNYVPCGNQSYFDDLSVFTPICYLQNTRIQRCVVDLTTNTTYMQFNFSLPANTNIHAYFSVVDPRNPQLNGYSYIGAEDINQINIKLESSANTYLFQTPPFAAAETQTTPIGALPVRGITYGTIGYANSDVGQLNVLDMSFKVSRSDITALKFEIPLVDASGAPIFGATFQNSFFNLQNGDEYPCGNNQVGIVQTGNHKCYLFYGGANLIGSPVQIIMTDFNQGTTINARLMLINPPISGMWVSVNVIAYTGTQNETSLYGGNVAGYWSFSNIYQIANYGAPIWAYNTQYCCSTDYLTSNKYLWRDLTTWTVYPLYSNVGDYVILEVLLYQYNDGSPDDQLCRVNFGFGNANTDDVIYLKSKEGRYQKAYFVKKWTGANWIIQYFKCKHYANGMRMWYSNAQTYVYIIDYSFTGWYPYYSTVGSISVLNYFYIFPLDKKTYIEFDLTSQMTTLFSQNFAWDSNAQYVLTIQSAFWPTIQKCVVVEGMVSSNMKMPVSCDQAGSGLYISGFTSILNNPRIGRYRVKLELQHSSYSSYNGVLTYSATVKMYAHPSGVGGSYSDWYIFSATSTPPNLFQQYNLPQTCVTCPVPNLPNYGYTHRTGNNFVTNLINVGMNAAQTTLQLQFTLTPTATIPMATGAYSYSFPQFRVVVNNYPFFCAGFTKYYLYMHRFGNAYLKNLSANPGGMVTCPRMSEIQINFFFFSTALTAEWGNIWGGVEGASWTTDITLQFDIEIILTGQIEPLNYRQWISIHNYVDLYQFGIPVSTWAWCYTCRSICFIWGSVCAYQAFTANSITKGFAEALWQPVFPLFSSVSLQPLTDNINEPTEMSVVFSSTQLSFGPASFGKIVLLQLTPSFNPFTYLNSSSTLLNRVQCKCMTSSLPGQLFDQTCYFRDVGLTSLNAAITIDIQLTTFMSATCYFPEWKVLAGSLSVTAKLTNDYGGFPSYYSTYTTYAGFYQTPSNTLTFTNAAALSAATLAETSTPSIYSPTSQVNTFQVDYALSIALPQATDQAIVYIDFQKGGIIPDLNLCTNTYFLFCRVYKTLRHIMVAQFKLPTAAGGTLLFNSNFNFNTYLPTHWEYGINSDYAIIARVIQTSTDNFYSFKGTFGRTAANLLPTPINVTINPERATGSLLSGFTTNIILSFNISNQTLYSFYSNNNAHIDITCSNPTILSTNRGCTVVSATNPMFQFYCHILESTLTIQNRYLATPFTTSGLVQVIIGIINPTAAITFTVTGYEYNISSTNYGTIFTGTGTYTPTVLTGVTVMQANQLKMYPFFTKIYSSTFAPFRIGFKLSTAISTITFPSYYFIINNLNVIGGFTYFQCLIRAFSASPASNAQTIFPNSYRSYKQRTQHQNMFVPCVVVAAGLQISIPGPGLKSGIFYELVVAPAGTTQSGFTNSADSLFSIIAHPTSSERIDQIYKYYPGSFTLVSMQVVTKRPLSSTALLLQFNVNINSPLTYPSHYFEIVFRDLNMTSIKTAYKTPGSKVPCTLSSLFVALPARKQSPLCVVQTLDLTVGTIVIRATQIGSIIIGAYTLTFDDFLLPDLVSPPLEDSSPFTLCLRLHDFANNKRYENCFDEIFVIDYSTYATAQIEATGAMSISDNMYGTLGITGMMNIPAYPLASTGLLGQKLMMRVNDGYAGTTAAPIALQGYTLLWFNQMVNLYVFQQKSISTGAPITLSLNSLSNPEVYQMALYTTGSPSIQLTFYDKHHPIQHYAFSQPTFSSFALQTSQIYATTVLYTDDVKQSIPFKSMFVFQLELVILDTPAIITAKQLNRISITFNSNVSKIEQCWIDTNFAGKSFRPDSACIVASPNSILLQDFQTAFNSNNLIIYVQLRLLGSTVTYDTTVYCINNQIQYFSTGNQLFSNSNSSLLSYPYLDFSQNLYTPGYYELSTQLNRTTPAKYLYFVLQIPADLIQSVVTFTITLPASILPSNGTTQKRMICEWLTTDKYLRKYNTGVHSICSFSTPTSIIVQAPYGGLPRLSSTNIPITYLLKVREFFVVNTLFTMPTVSTSLEIVLTHQNSAVLLQDTLIIYPYATFQSGQLSVNTFTRTAGELNTYDITFTPQDTISIDKQAVLELSIDSRYMPSYLGLKDLYKQYGTDTTNTSWMNNAGFNIGYSYLPTNWVNGLPYTGYTSTHANAEQTVFEQDSNAFRISLLLESQFLGGVSYNWKIPLLMNPANSNITFRMNLTLYTYWAGTARHQKELFYEVINPYLTLPYNSAQFNYTFTSSALSNTIQSSAATINIDFTYPFVPDSTNVVELKISNRGVALIGLSNFYNYVYNDASYNFYFFKRINLILGLKNVNDNSPTINLGALQQTNNFVDYFGYDWVKIHSNAIPQTVYNAGSLFAPLVSCTILTVTPNVVEGISTQAGSQFLQQFTFTTPCAIQKGSIMQIQYDGLLYSWSKQSPCYTSFKSASCSYASNGTLSLNFNQNIAAIAIITFSVYLKASQTTTTLPSNILGYIYALPQNKNTTIETIPLLNTLISITASTIFDGKMQNLLILPLYQNTYMPLLGRLKPHYLPLTYIQITHPFTWTPTSHHRFLYRLNNSDLLDDSKSLKWMQANQTVSSGSMEKWVLEPNGQLDYALYSSLQYTFLMSSTYDSAKLNNFSIGAVGKFYNFIYESEKQIEYQEVYPVPVADKLTMIVPIKAVNEPTALGIKFKMQTKSIKPGDIIEIYLDSFNLMKNMYQFTTTPIECAEGVKGVLTASADLICDVWQYPQNKKQMIIRVFPKISVPANTFIEIWLSPLINPPATMVAGAIVKVTIDCLGQQRCQIYQARGYYSTKGLTVNQYGDTISTFAPSNLEVLKTNVAHTFTFTTQTVTAAMLDYPENYDNVMTHSCSNSLGKCIVFPNQKRVVVVPTVATSLSSLQLLIMNNGMYVSPLSQYINLTIASSSLIQVYNTNHSNLTTIKTIYTFGTPNTMTIIPTQSPNLFLRNYMNTAIITISGLYTDPYITAFYIHAPKDIVTWDTTYCNATLGTGGNNPYPTRLSCAFINDTTLSINIPEGVPYVPGVTDAQSVFVNCKFYIKDFSAGQNILYVSTPVISNTFNAYGSYSQKDDDYHFFATEVAQTITISQYQIPPIGNIQFTTESYQQRFANINDRLYFDLLFDPATTDTISTIEIKLPRQFGYPPVGNHDACLMVSRTTFPLQNCQEVRRDNDTFILITPPATYNNGPVIITIANQNYSNWFTAPSQSGSWYNYTVSAYGANGQLLERQFSENCSNIGGLELEVPNMTIHNGLDAMMEEIVDISFVVGASAMHQGYPGSLGEGSYYTNIKITFQNWGAFNNLLGINSVNQSLIGCVTKGLIHFQEIKCELIGGSDIEHEPSILISGYERVPPLTKVSISLPNILMLNTNTRNVLSVSVVLYKIGSWQQSYLYNPEGLVLKQTSNLAFLPANFVDIGYAGINRVGASSTFYLAVNPSVDITSYFVVKLPLGFINPNYTLFSSSSSNCNFQIFYRSNLVRIYPNGGVHTAGTLINYTISNFPSTSYAISAANFPIQFEAYSNYKQRHSQIFYMVFQSYPCSVTFGLISLSSPYIFDTNISYVFEISMPDIPNYPDKSTISLTIPQEYPSLFSKGVKCFVVSPMQCSILTERMIEVQYIEQTNSSKILVQLHGLTNPSTTNNSFKVQTYSGDNINQVKCQSSIAVILRKTDIQNCSLTVEAALLTMNTQTKYHFTIICPNVLRNSSNIQVFLSKDYLTKNSIGPLNCWSDDPLNLLSGNCFITYTNATLFIVFKNINTWKNQVSIGLNAIFNNTIYSRTYNYQAFVDLYGEIYGNTKTQSLIFVSNAITKITSINLYNLPRAGGSQSIYILKLPSKFISTSLQIDFPPYFDMGGQVVASTYFSNNANWFLSLTYFELLQYTYQFEVPSSVYLTSLGGKTITAQNITKGNGTWFYLLLKLIINPSYYDNTYAFSVRSINTYKQLLYIYEGPLSIQINVPSQSIHMIGLSTDDSDLTMLAVHSISYRVDDPIYTNYTSFVITPPKPANLYAISTLQCCLILDYTQLVECNQCRIGMHEIQFTIATQGLTLTTDQIFTIQLTSLFTPGSSNQCKTLQDYLRSYYALLVFRNGTVLTHSSIQPSADDFTPCQTFTPTRGDVLFNPPTTLYAGLAYEVPISISRPSKMLRVFLNSPSYDLSFTPDNGTYFNSYDIQGLSVFILVNPNSKAARTTIKITHNESIVYNIFRDNLPVMVTIRTDPQEYVEILQSEYFSVGNFISIPVTLTHIASYDIYLSFVLPDQTPSLFESQTNPILIPALTNRTNLRFRYNGTTVPQTLNITLQLQSSSLIKHILRPSIVYFFFSTTSEFQTLPPVMKLNVMHQYINNSHFGTRKIYNVNSSPILYDQLKPFIIKHDDVSIGSTRASIIIFTRHEAEVYYVLLERGYNYTQATPQNIRTNALAKMSITARNSSQYVNAYTIINFTRLEHQTMYSVYAMAHDSLGDSTSYIIHNFMTKALSNAVQLRLDTSTLITDVVYLVHAVSQILNIDILRVKGVDSYIIKNQTWTKNRLSKNQLYYRNLIVVSPSLIQDTPLPIELVTSRLVNNPDNRQRLKQFLPQFIDNFDERKKSTNSDEWPLIELIISLPKIKTVPNVTSISYYNISLTYQLWSKGIIYAVAVQRCQVQKISLFNASRTKYIYGSNIGVLTDDIPYSKQIILRRDSYNRNISSFFSNKTDSEGNGKIYFTNLKSGTKYDIYITFTTPELYEPILYASTPNIMTFSMVTLENPNIKGKDDALVLKELKTIDPEMYEIIKSHKNLEKNKKNLN